MSKNSNSFCFRRKPKTITATITIPEPMREAPEVGTEYWTISAGRGWRMHWDNDPIDQRKLKRSKLLHNILLEKKMTTIIMR